MLPLLLRLILDKRGDDKWPDYRNTDFSQISQAVDEIQAAIENSPANRLMKDI